MLGIPMAKVAAMPQPFAVSQKAVGLQASSIHKTRRGELEQFPKFRHSFHEELHFFLVLRKGIA